MSLICHRKTVIWTSDVGLKTVEVLILGLLALVIILKGLVVLKIFWRLDQKD